MANGRSPEIEKLLRADSLVDDPPIQNAEKTRKGKKVHWVSTQAVRGPHDDPEKMAACQVFTATMTEFYIGANEQRSPLISSSIYELLYGQGPRAIRKEKFTERPNEHPSFTWYHLPANNVSYKRRKSVLSSLLLFTDLPNYDIDGMG